MEKTLSKLKTSSIVSFIFAFISISWLIIDYFLLREIFRDAKIVLGFEMVLLIMSAVIFSVFIFSVFVTSYQTFRLVMEIRSEKKKNQTL